MIDSPGGRRSTTLYWALFAVGLALSLVMALRSQVEGDQINLLLHGWILAVDGVWLPYGVPTSAGGNSPGGLIALLIGAPLWLWHDFRAPALFFVLLNAVTFVLLERSLRPLVGIRGSWLLLILWWWNPWRLFFGSHIWSPNYMLVIGALHLLTSVAMRRRPRFWVTFSHVSVLGLAAQVHSSFVVLALLSLVLWRSRLIRVHWGGFAVATTLGTLTAIPWLLAVLEDSSLIPQGEGFLFRGLLLVQPALRGVMYWFKLGSLSTAGRMLRFDFTPVLGEQADALLTPVAIALGLAAHLSLLLPLWATWRLLRWMRRHRPWRRFVSRVSNRSWLQAYAGLAFVLSVLAFAMSPTPIMFWQVFMSLHAVVLACMLLCLALLRSRVRVKTQMVARVWTVTAVLLCLCMTFASPMYRRGGRTPATTVLTIGHPMLESLGISARTTVTVDRETGWRPRDIEGPATP